MFPVLIVLWKKDIKKEHYDQMTGQMQGKDVCEGQRTFNCLEQGRGPGAGEQWRP